MIFPPLLPLSGLFGGLVLGWIFPLTRSVNALPRDLRWPVGFSFIAVGLIIVIGSRLALLRAKTNVDPRRPTLRLVQNWPFSWSRNPIYLGGNIIYVGVALATPLYGMLLLWPILLVILHFGVVRREEAYLRGKFGAEYDNYLSRVRRWF